MNQLEKLMDAVNHLFVCPDDPLAEQGLKQEYNATKRLMEMDPQAVVLDPIESRSGFFGLDSLDRP